MEKREQKEKVLKRTQGKETIRKKERDRLRMKNGRMCYKGPVVRD